MEVYSFFTAVIVCGIVYFFTNWWQKRKERLEEKPKAYVYPAEDTELKIGTDKPMPHVDMKTTNDKKLEKTTMEEQKGTRDLLLETLTKIGCQYELAEEEGDDRIFFAFQGEHFFADAKNDWRYIHLWDTHWARIDLYDVDEFSRLRKAINLSNLNNCVTTIYTIDEEGKNVDVHCKSTVLLIPQIPEIDNYLRIELNEFFRAHQFVGNEMVKLREKEEAVKQ